MPVGEYAPVSSPPDPAGPARRRWEPPAWQSRLLEGASPVPVLSARRDPTSWPGYAPRPAVALWRVPRLRGAVAAVWDFDVYGGSFGEDDATALVAAAGLAREQRVPLVTLVRSGGTRLQEGMAALVGIPRARVALLALAAAGLPHLSVADAPTTGGVWISVGAAADLRVAVAGATVGFAGPRVVEAVTGALPGPDSHTAAAAAAAGLVDAALAGDDVPAWLERAVAAVAPAVLLGTGAPAPEAPRRTAGTRSGAEQVRRSRAPRASGADLLDRLLPGAVSLAAPHGDDTVAVRLGRTGGTGGTGVVAVALAARQGVRPGPDGYRLATRAFRLADRLGLPVLTLVDTPGAEPGPAAERDGIAPAMGEALDALLGCRSPTLCLLHGEGGSGGALAVAAADRLLVTPDSWFAAIAPEGAAAALRRPAEECAELLRLTPADLLALGAADALVEGPDEVLAALAALVAQDPQQRRDARRDRWSRPLPRTLGPR